MSNKEFSHIGLLSTIDLDKIREFYEAFWALISDRRQHKDQRRRAHRTGAHRRTRSAATRP